VEEVEGSGGSQSVWRRSEDLEVEALDAIEGCGGGRKLWTRSKCLEVEVSGGG